MLDLFGRKARKAAEDEHAAIRARFEARCREAATTNPNYEPGATYTFDFTPFTADDSRRAKEIYYRA